MSGQADCICPGACARCPLTRGGHTTILRSLAAVFQPCSCSVLACVQVEGTLSSSRPVLVLAQGLDGGMEAELLQAFAAEGRLAGCTKEV